MKIEQINDGETIETIDVITHRQDIFAPDNVVKFDEFREVESRVITDGELVEASEPETILIEKYELEDGYVMDDVDYIRKSRLLFKNYTYIILYGIAFKTKTKMNVPDIYIEPCNMTAYIKDINDLSMINKVRKITKSVKKTCRKINNPLSSFRSDFITQPIDKCESEELAENVYKLKRF